MLIDCDDCAVRGPACEDCVVSVLLGTPSVRDAGPSGPGTPPALRLDETEELALAALADAGMVPRLRLVSTRRDPDGSGESRRAG